MANPLRRRRWILCSANNGVNVVMYKPILRRIEDDPRLRIHHTGTLSHTRQFQEEERADLNRFFSRHGVQRGVLHFRVARFMPWDVYLSPNFSQRIIPRFAKLKVQIFHGVSFKNCAIKPKSTMFDRLFLPGPYHRRQFIERGLFEEGDPRLVMTGLPKVDRLVDGSIDPAQVLLALDLDPALPTVLYAPTGDSGNSLNRHGEAIIEALLDLPINLIVKPHDHASEDPECSIDWPTRLSEWRHERLRADLGSDIVPLLAAADLLLTDASSVAFEYTLVDRPIVFFDVPEILYGMRKSKIDLDTWGRKGGEIVKTADELREVVPRLLENPEEKGEIRRAIANDLFFEPGTATDRAVRRLYEDLELELPETVKDVEAAVAG
ncbi:MAG: CDP-glycerol glycerophosphotransferase family protein [Planctomycetota bacterium JB042]